MPLIENVDPDAFCEAFIVPDGEEGHLHQRLVASGRLEDVVETCLANSAFVGEHVMVLLDGDGWPPHHLIKVH